MYQDTYQQKFKKENVMDKQQGSIKPTIIYNGEDTYIQEVSFSKDLLPKESVFYEKLKQHYGLIDGQLRRFVNRSLEETMRYPSSIDGGSLWESIESYYPKDKWIRDSTGVLMSNSQSIWNPILDNLVKPAVKEIELLLGLKAKYMMVNILPAKVIVPVHTDTLVEKSVSRWHLPLVTNPDAWLWEKNRGFRHLSQGFWYEVDYRNGHAIGNFGESKRVHLIIDLF